MPANQIDTRDMGFVVAEAGRVADALGPGNFLNIYRVTKRANGTMDVSSAKKLLVPSYNIPAYAPQPGSRYVLDTLDARNTQAITAFDPPPGEMALGPSTPSSGSGLSDMVYTTPSPFPCAAERQLDHLRPLLLQRAISPAAG